MGYLKEKSKFWQKYIGKLGYLELATSVNSSMILRFAQNTTTYDSTGKDPILLTR